ncbi:MAG: TorF family putative porin, partial [Verrucomicrobiales bacterium]
MKLKSLLTLGMSVFAASAFAGAPGQAPAPVQPAEEPLGFSVTVGYDSHYIFRGVEFAENLVSAAIDGTLPLTDMLSLNVGAWYGTSADDSGILGGSFHELDLYAALLADLGPATVGVKFTEYLFDGDSAFNDAPEIGLLLSTTAGPVDVIAGAYYDFEAEGFYFETGISKSIAVT